MADVLALRAFLVTAAGEPFRFGEWDCAMTIANWVREQTGEDPARDLRGRYGTDEEWQAIVAGAGGLTPLVGRLALAAGMARVEDPAPGDIGVVRVPTVGEAAAIRVERGWVTKLNVGLTALNAKHYAAWRL